MDLDPELKAFKIAQAAVNRTAEDVTVLDMRPLMSICDYFVLCSGRSRLHVNAIAEEIEEAMEAEGLTRRHREGIPDSSWVITDFDDVVVHIFEPHAREFYNLEGLWGDAPRLEIPEEQAEPEKAE